MFFLPVTSNYYLPTKNHDNHITLFVESFAFSTKSKQNAYKKEKRGFFFHNEKTTNVRERRAADRPNYIVAVLCFFSFIIALVVALRFIFGFSHI